MKKTILTALAAMILLLSCSKTFYQVYTTKAPEMIEKDNSLIYENNDCRLTYNLWSDCGDAGFALYNKTERDLFIILPQTFFIKNGVAYDYFKNQETRGTETYVTSSSTALGVSSGVDYYYPQKHLNISKSANILSSKTKETTVSIVTYEKPIICIPPHATKFIGNYTILGSLIRNCDTKQAYPKKSSLPLEYTKDNSPVVFKNRIAYSFNKEGDNINYIENEFWVSELINYRAKQVIETKIYKECDNDIGVERDYFIFSGPNKFYQPYRGPLGKESILK